MFSLPISEEQDKIKSPVVFTYEISRVGVLIQSLFPHRLAVREVVRLGVRDDGVELLVVVCRRRVHLDLERVLLWKFSQI